MTSWRSTGTCLPRRSSYPSPAARKTCSRLKRGPSAPPWQHPSSAPAPPQDSPDGSGRRRTPRAGGGRAAVGAQPLPWAAGRPATASGRWAPNHRLGRRVGGVLEPAACTVAACTVAAFGLQDFVLPPRLNKAFRHGLAKAAQALTPTLTLTLTLTPTLTPTPPPTPTLGDQRVGLHGRHGLGCDAARRAGHRRVQRVLRVHRRGHVGRGARP